MHLCIYPLHASLSTDARISRSSRRDEALACDGQNDGARRAKWTVPEMRQCDQPPLDQDVFVIDSGSLVGPRTLFFSGFGRI